MKLIADSGSTKTDWVLINTDTVQNKINTMGYNPYFMDSERIYQSLITELTPNIAERVIDEIWFYGAGCSTDEKKQTVATALQQAFPKTNKIYVDHDLVASAKALLGNNPGFAAILGTGANTCLYNGKEVALNVESLGFMLGDEGSGCYLGRKLVRDYMRKLMPESLWQDFNLLYGLSNEQILEAVYYQEFPNRFLASFAKFAEKHKTNEYIRSKVSDSFHDFFKNTVCKYPDYQKYPFNCVGSIAYIFKDILLDKATDWGMQPGKIIKSPIDDLVAYHMNKD